MNLNFPIDFSFRITTLSNDFTAKDADGNTFAYVRQKLFKLKEEIIIFSDETKENISFKIKANKWIDFSAAYTIRDKNDNEIGRVARKGWASIWKAKYEMFDHEEKHIFTVREANVWAKVFDGILGEIPFLNFFTGYLFNPSYNVIDKEEQVRYKLKKMRSLLGKNFKITEELQTDPKDTARVILGLMMVVLLERRRG